MEIALTDIVERLRTRAHSHQKGCEICEAADEIARLRALLHRRTEALHNIAIGGNGEHNWTIDEMRTVAWDELKFLPQTARRALEPKP